MTQVHQCKDNSDLSPLSTSRGLYLKPIARINVTVHYPQLKQSLTTGGKSISSWDVMARIKGLVSPELFISLKVVKNTLEFIRFEGDLENREILKRIVSRLDGKTMKVTGFKEPLKILAAEAKLSFPSKYDWDSYFRDAKNMNEMKAGERPDTIHFQNLPCKWFSDSGGKSSGSGDKDNKILPSDKIFRRVFDVFGEVRATDIPVCDPYRSQMSTAVRGISTFTFSNDNVFEAYIQYKDYMSFVKAMDALRGCSLFYQESPIGKYWVANIKIDFDKSKHLSDESIKKRRVERERLMDKDNVKKTAEKLSKVEAEVREQKQQEKDKKENEKNLAKIEYKIAMEERKYLIARRKLEAIRLMDFLFETLKKNIIDIAERKRVLKEKTKEEMHKLEKLVIEKNTRATDRAQPKPAKHPPKIRKLESAIVSIPNKDVEHRRRSRSRSVERSEEEPAARKTEEKDKKPNHYNNRYIGDWEVKAKSHGGSEIKVPGDYVPVSASSFRGRGRGGPYRGRGRFPHNGPPEYLRYHPDAPLHPSHYPPGPPPHPEYGNPSERPPHHHPHPFPFRGRGRGYHYHHHQPPPGPYPNHRERGDPGHYEEQSNEPNQTVRHDYSYLDELDRAYEKYFVSITKRHDNDQ